jgi:uncharacterized membrane protein YcaP (DUF421 family)
LDWARIFLPTVPVLEIVIRGTAMYLVLFVLLRVTLKRIGGMISLGDILMVALVAAAVQNSIARDNQSIADGVLLVGTVTFWSYTLDWLGHRSVRFQRFYNPPALLLVQNGRMLHRNMRQELITEDELLSQLRRNGVKNLAEVKEAYMEGDGSITVIERKRPHKHG